MENSSQYYFTASMNSGKTLCSLLKSIQFQESALFCAMPDGLKLTVEEGKCIQASAYIPADNFTEYCIKKNVDIMFRISLAVLTECLSILGASEESSIKMYYKNDGSPLILMLQSQSYDNLITDCEIYTLSTSTILDFSDDDATEVSKIIVKPPAFLGLLADLERSSDVIELHFSPIHPNFSIITYGDQDRSCIDVPKSSDMVQSFSCDTTISFKYPFPLLRLIMKALAISSKMVLHCSSNGLLLLQMKLEKEDLGQMFSEFYILPLLDV